MRPIAERFVNRRRGEPGILIWTLDSRACGDLAQKVAFGGL
jgi:hypothetical protein